MRSKQEIEDKIIEIEIIIAKWARLGIQDEPAKTATMILRWVLED